MNIITTQMRQNGIVNKRGQREEMLGFSLDSDVRLGRLGMQRDKQGPYTRPSSSRPYNIL